MQTMSMYAMKALETPYKNKQQRVSTKYPRMPTAKSEYFLRATETKCGNRRTHQSLLAKYRKSLVKPFKIARVIQWHELFPKAGDSSPNICCTS
ncbi:hypothetical protein NDU88_005676 [Pleurodeles waltl]|uniref:Uncharacterized protein n=1 Tax=Pleurodeles waltl TaxID=8319 RepID=A0AAV7UIT7_PLEWA|nr:hypothetical protein NDU88_005676 [Pleurodeles waltl]